MTISNTALLQRGTRYSPTVAANVDTPEETGQEVSLWKHHSCHQSFQKCEPGQATMSNTEGVRAAVLHVVIPIRVIVTQRQL